MKQPELMPVKIPEEQTKLSPFVENLIEKYHLAISTNGQPIPNIDNVQRILDKMDYDVFYDEFYEDIVNEEGSPWKKENTWALTTFLQRNLGLARIATSIVEEGIEAYAALHRRNAPKDWINSLPEWDRKPRVGSFLIDCAGADDNVYTRAVSVNFWVSLVARIFRPGCQVDSMIILEGPQGTKKSSLLEVIGGRWHGAPTASIESKDFYICLRGKLIIEFADLSSFYKAEINKLKHMITLRTDTYRGLWDKRASDHPRQSVFAGTTNDSVYLGDETGARRFLPVLTHTIDLELAKNTRVQLFAEALFMYNFDHTWHELPPQALEEQEARRTADPWEYYIKEYVRSRPSVQTSNILLECLKIESGKQTKFDTIRVGRILKMLRWDRRNIMENLERKYIYFPPELLTKTEMLDSPPQW